MKYLKIKNYLLLLLIAAIVVSACNKDVEQFPDIQVEKPGTALAGIADTLASSARSNNSLYSAIIKKAGMAEILNNRSSAYTIYVPSNAAVKTLITALTGGAVPAGSPDAVYLGFIQSANFTEATAKGIVSYNTLPGKINYTTLGTTFPNYQAPSIFNPMPSLSALLRLTIFPSARNGNFVNNVPVIAAGIEAGNGIIYETGAVVVPPQRYLWDRINTDPDFTYLKAAVLRADSGTVAGNPASSLVAALQSIGANLTVFAPSDAVFKATLYTLAYPVVRAGIYAQARAGGLSEVAANAYADSEAPANTTALTGTPAVFSNPVLFSVLPAISVRGVIAYHILGSRAFANNFPATAANFPTLLNGSIAAHPGVVLQATFAGPMVTAATVKGAVNPTAANIAINPTPDPNGTSDQHYLNGVLHKINQVLMPMQLTF